MKLNVAIVMGKCSKYKESFGVRFEEKAKNVWVADWAFRIKDRIANKEGYGSMQLSGSFAFSEEFPGCPYCGSSNFFVCSCLKIACYDGVSNEVTCPSCNRSAQLGGPVQSLSAGGDR